MESDLTDLQITAENLEDLVDLNFSSTLALDLCRALSFKNYQQGLSVLITEFLVLLVVLIFVMPVSLIVLRSSGNLPEDSTGISQLLIVILGIAILGISVWNLYLCQRAKQSKSLAQLMEEVDKYNGIIKTLALIDQLESVENYSSQLPGANNRKEVIEALKVTKSSLVSALQVEKIIRKHQGFIDRRYQLLSELENNLTTLMTFDRVNQTSEYGRLLNESLQIGMTVHKEVRNLQK
ncbi:MAG: hypothetical protein F6J86_34030 [Symploca sp. SIO1B1]|nr:hypothetical protein [Symploca sp. SIO2D2]NER24356.1 hypothetical protein [Symploca sp. SIO1C2]NER49911.1 hypothetical protein [Symploca sp. SIO1A3]NER98789.1 hypothetical protein [Symploca sp. SIO1B1]